MTYTGGCACGRLRYATEAEPMFQSHCQCAHCRMRSGTGHGSYVTFARASEVAITGTPRRWEHLGDSGTAKAHGFCETCGTTVFLTFAAMPDLLTIHAGTLDKPEAFRPQVVTYASRALPWDLVDPALPAFATMAG